MKNIKYCISCVFLLCMFLLVGLPACNDVYDTHYGKKAGVTPEFTLWQLIEQDEQLSKFAEMLKKTGYDTFLASSQSFTVWAPTNDALQGVDIANETNLKDIVMTHIARYKSIADSRTDTIVITLNSKLLRFTGNGGKYSMNGAELATANHLASNGILHVMKEQVPFVKNLWEYFTEPDMDSIRNYFNTFNIRMFSPGASTVIDYVDGMAVYDSIFHETNELFYTRLQGVGFLNNEDSLYSMILPNNTAWRKAYNQRKTYFETTAPNADSVQHWNTQYAIIQDLVFRGRIDVPNRLDSIISTRGNVFRDPANLFPNVQPKQASNGLVYITDELKHDYWESWQHPIQIEAEMASITPLESGIISTPARIGTFYIPTQNDVPSRLCRLISNGNNSPTESTFLLINIANTLKAEYKVYAVFAPIRYIYPNFSSERTKILYDIQQADRSTLDRPIDRQVWTSLIGLPAGSNGKRPDDVSNETDSATVKKMLLTTITFPEANYNEELRTIRLKLSSRITSADARNGGYNNRMLLDYIILEPVNN